MSDQQPDQQPTQISSRYKLEFEQKTSRLMGVVLPADTKSADDDDTPPEAPVTLRSLNEHLEACGFKDYRYFTNSVQQFLRKIQRFETGTYPLAEKLDAKIVITISHDKTTARVQTEVAFGGAPLTQKTILSHIEKAKIHKDAIDNKMLVKLTTADGPVDIILAKAVPPIHGENAFIEPLLESKTKAEHDADSAEAFDQLEVFEFTVVDPGDELMRKTPATKGTNGMNVQGKAIKANPGRDIQFTKPFEGVKPKDGDENILVSEIKGHPVFNPNGVKVDPMMAVDNVDIHSGHIEYDGSLMVKKNVEPGFKINVTGDVFVKGTILKAHIYAGGSITISGGVNADDIDDEHTCHLEAGGDITGKYFQHTHIVCKGDLHVAEYLMQCRTTVEGTVYAGQERGRGCIIGGHTASNTGIVAKSLGNEAYMNTVISLGTEIELQKEAAALTQQLKRRQKEEQQLGAILQKIQSTGTPTNLGAVTLDKSRKIENTVRLLQEKINEMAERLDELKRQIIITEELSVRVTGMMYPNVFINILDHPWMCEEQRRRCQLVLQGDKIVLDTLQD